MSEGLAVGILLGAGVVGANIPWLSERLFLVLPVPGGVKGAWWRLAEWLVLYLVVGLVALGIERQLTGETHAQDWEFYVVTICLFIVFALPGFIYRYELKRHLEQR